MLSSVLRSKRAVNVNIEIMRAFVRLREILATHKDLANKVEMLEKQYGAQFKVVFDAIRQLMTPPEPNKRKIGFSSEGEGGLLRKKIVRHSKFENSRNLGFLKNNESRSRSTFTALFSPTSGMEVLWKFLKRGSF